MALKGLKKDGAPADPYAAHLGTPEPVQVVTKPIQSLVTQYVSTKGNKEPVPTETVTQHKGLFQKSPNAMAITVEGGRTMNLGNYESAKIGVTITVPCDPDSLKEAYEWATDFVSSKISEAIDLAKGV
jgi:hypothetical protein